MAALFGFFPHAQIGFGGAEDRFELLVGDAVAADVFDEFGKQADVDQAFGVEVQDAVGDARLGEGDVAGNAFEGVGDGVLLWSGADGFFSKSGTGGAGESVQIEAESSFCGVAAGGANEIEAVFEAEQACGGLVGLAAWFEVEFGYAAEFV